MVDPQTTGLPPLSSLRDWHVGATDHGLSEVRIVLADPAEAKAWLQWMFDRQETEFDV